MSDPAPALSHSHLDDRLLGGILRQGDAAASDTELEHLGGCPQCQQRLDALAADADFWSRSRVLLSEDLGWSTGELASDAPISVTDSSDAVSDALIDVVRSLFDPSDEPRSLGRVARMEILGIVGSGGMGVVMKALDVDLDRVVAVKMPSPHLWRSAATLALFEREARSAAAVVHPHVIAIHHVGRWKDVPYLVMPYLPGKSLDRLLSDAGPLPLERAVALTRQLSEALSAAHARGVVHRDVKPGNVLTGRGGERAVLSDFGLAKIHDEATATASGLVLGTPAYLALEQARGDRSGPPGDVFSLGAVLWSMLTARVPFTGQHPHVIVGRIARGEPLEWSDNDHTPPWARRLVEWMRAESTAERPTAEQVAAVLRQCQRHLADPANEPLPEVLASATSRWTTRTRRRLMTLAAGLAAVLLVADWWMLGVASRRQNSSPAIMPAVTLETPPLNEPASPLSRAATGAAPFAAMVPPTEPGPSPGDLRRAGQLVEEVEQVLREVQQEFPQ